MPRIVGTPEADEIDGSSDGEMIDGRDGEDELLGGAGDDQLFGGGDSDVLSGGEGFDRMTGGLGSDIFVIDSVDAVDTVTDFRANYYSYALFGRDKLDLSVVLAKHTEFDGGSAGDARAKGYVVLEQVGKAGEPGYGTRVYIDADGAGQSSGAQAVAFLEGVFTPYLNEYSFIV
jgi:Ca2+-binding RTX toxin-like protein